MKKQILDKFGKYLLNKFILLTILFWLTFFFSNSVLAAPVLDNTAGTYTDNFANNTGVPTRSYVNINTGTGVLQLTNTSNQSSFVAPFRASGNAISGNIKPVLIAKWGMLNITATIPVGTTIRVQIMDDYNNPFTDDVISGNFEQGVDVSQISEIDLSKIPILYCAVAEDPSWGGETSCEKTTSVKIKFIMTTVDTTVTPSVDGISINWTKTQGALEPSGISGDDPWPTDYGDQQKTSSSQYHNEQTYPAFRWASVRHSGDPYYPDLYVLRDKILGYTYNSEGRLFSLDRDTGEEQWKIPGLYIINSPGVVAENGTLYGLNINVDYATAVDSNSGEVKWVYNWMGGHGGGVVLQNNGKIYYLRDDASSPNSTLIEQNPDGTIASQTVLNVVPEGLSGETRWNSTLTLGSNNTAYFITDVSNSTTSKPTGKGRLFAINLDTKQIEWSRLGDFEGNVVVDAEGTAYVFSKRLWDGEVTTKKVVAVKADGTLKWERDGGSDTGTGYNGYNTILRNDGMLIAQRTIDGTTYQGVIEVIDSSNGRLVSTNESDGTPQFADGLSGYYYTDSVTIDSDNNLYKTRMNYADSAGNLKWKISYPYDSHENGKYSGYSLTKLAPDERGWLYGGFTKNVQTLDDYIRVRSESFAKTYALAPWTLSDLSAIAAEQKPGNVLNFNVVTNIQTANPLFGGDNKVQVVMSNGDKIILTSTSSDSSNNTIWTGSYTIPANFSEGSASYTVEASQAYLQTDIKTHFDSAPTESDNTGIIIAKGFTNDATPPGNGLNDIFLKFGKTKKKLERNSNNFVKQSSFKLLGINEETKNGQIKIYKKNSNGNKKEIGATTVDENGKWEYEIKEKDGKNTYYIRAFDSVGNEASSASSFVITQDTHKPYFTSFPETGVYQRRAKLSFEAKDDETEVDYCKTKNFSSSGHWKKQKSNFYIIPNSISAGAHVLLIKARDQAGNTITRRLSFFVK